MQRTPFEHRWDSQSLDQVGVVPWKNSLGVGDEEMGMSEVEIRQAPSRTDRAPIPRRLYIRSKDIGKYGATSEYSGCVATMCGVGHVLHTDSCRDRVTKKIDKGEEGDGMKRVKPREVGSSRGPSRRQTAEKKETDNRGRNQPEQ